MPKLKDVAALAGVSSATASRVLTGSSYVSPDVRERVLHAIEQLNYRPDQIARSLRRRRTQLIGLVVSTIENVFFTEVARAAEHAAHQRGYNLIVCNTDESLERERAYLNILDEQLVAGIILAPAPGSGPHRAEVAEKVPMVLINRRLDEIDCCSIVADDETVAYQCVEYLAGQGRRRIAAITGLPGISTTRVRLSGYRRGLENAGFDRDPALELGGGATLEGGYQAARQLMALPAPPDALFVFNNVMTQGVVIALQDLGLCWPDQVDIAGFGAFDVARLYRPPVTLIAQPTREMGELAVQRVIDQVEGRQHDGPKATVLPNRLVPREEWLQAGRAQLVPVDGPLDSTITAT